MITTDPMSKLYLSGRLARLFSTAGERIAESEPDGTERELVRRLVNDDLSALDELYRAHHAMLRAFAIRLLGDESAAEDLVHDVFLQVPHLIRKFRGHSGLRSFLVGVASNLASRHVRSASRRRAALARLAAERAPEFRDHEGVTRERLTRVYRALDALSIEQRTAFVLCEIEERSALEASELLGIPEGTVRTRCFHARRKLAKTLARLANEEGA